MGIIKLDTTKKSSSVENIQSSPNIDVQTEDCFELLSFIENDDENSLTVIDLNNSLTSNEVSKHSGRY